MNPPPIKCSFGGKKQKFGLVQVCPVVLCKCKKKKKSVSKLIVTLKDYVTFDRGCEKEIRIYGMRPLVT